MSTTSRIDDDKYYLPEDPAMPVERLESLPAEAARAEVRREIETGDVVEFAKGGIAHGERVVAVASEDRMQALGFEGLGQRAIRLSADTIHIHEDRFGEFKRVDWLRVQRLVDAGKVVEEGRSTRSVVIEEDGRRWWAVLKRTGNGEIYVVSYRRTNQRELERIERRGRRERQQPLADPKATRRT